MAPQTHANTYTHPVHRRANTYLGPLPPPDRLVGELESGSDTVGVTAALHIPDARLPLVAKAVVVQVVDMGLQ